MQTRRFPSHRPNSSHLSCFASALQARLRPDCPVGEPMVHCCIHLSLALKLPRALSRSPAVSRSADPLVLPTQTLSRASSSVASILAAPHLYLFLRSLELAVPPNRAAPKYLPAAPVSSRLARLVITARYALAFRDHACVFYTAYSHCAAPGSASVPHRSNLRKSP